MDIVFINFARSKTSDPHGLLHNLADKINLKKSDKFVVLLNLSIHYTWKNIKKSHTNNKFKISSPTYYVSDIQDYFEYIVKKHKNVLIILHNNISK